MKYIQSEDLLDFFKRLYTEKYSLIDYFAAKTDGNEVNLYYLFSDYHALPYHVFTQTKNLEVSSIISIFKNANWYEREIFEKFKVNFIGHPNLRPLMAAE